MTDTNAGTARIFRSDDGGYTVAHQRPTQAGPSFWYYPTLAEARAAYPGAVLEAPGDAASSFRSGGGQVVAPSPTGGDES